MSTFLCDTCPAYNNVCTESTYLDYYCEEFQKKLAEYNIRISSCNKFNKGFQCVCGEDRKCSNTPCTIFRGN